ncbi:multiprotein-bridging factor 1 family protein [Streptomyces uncialis]|uniref:helix-turn-helix domain-containing protein n=1 Tax=Streptomyces uncialis TaxID=1048205 RepID=UPI0038707ABB|nr:helix-turn-helix domain-containing protein [Streptomyces uncialis]
MTLSSSGSVGAVVRAARTMANLTQQQLGELCAIAQSGISRIERGQHVPDAAERRALAKALKLNVPLLGLSTGDDGDTSEVDMLRRDLITATGAIGLASVLPGAPSPTAAPVPWDAVLLRQPHPGRPLTAPQIRTALATVVGYYADAHYAEAADAIPTAVAAADRNAHDHGGRGAAALLTRAYVLATAVAVKERGDLAMITADRAVQAARLSQDPLAAAMAARAQTVVLRQRGHHTQARQVADNALNDLVSEPTARPVIAHIALESAYGAAQAGQTTDALNLWAQANELAERGPTTTHWPDHAGPLTPDQLHRYALCIHHLLGDTRSALHHASQVAVRAMPTAERRARYRHDSAKLAQDLGDLPRALALLREHEAETPQDARRSSLRRMVSGMLATSPSLPGLRKHATLVGAA